MGEVKKHHKPKQMMHPKTGKPLPKLAPTRKALVDSSHKQLNMGEVVRIASLFTKEPYPPDVVALTIAHETTMPGVKLQQFGNTLFIIHPLPNPSDMLFRAFNADTATRYARNARDFAAWAYEQGYDRMVTQFKDGTLLRLFRFVSKNPPNPQMGYQAQRTEDGGYQVTVKLGPTRGSEG